MKRREYLILWSMAIDVLAAIIKALPSNRRKTAEMELYRLQRGYQEIMMRGELDGRTRAWTEERKKRLAEATKERWKSQRENFTLYLKKYNPRSFHNTQNPVETITGWENIKKFFGLKENTIRQKLSMGNPKGTFFRRGLIVAREPELLDQWLIHHEQESA